MPPEQVEVAIGRAEAGEGCCGLRAERDAMRSYGGKKTQQRGLWPALKHYTGKGLASVFRRRQDAVCLRLQALLEPFGITRFSTDGWGSYERHIAPEQHAVGKPHTQKIENKPINLRTRIKRWVRRTICLSKTECMHDLVIGLFINRYEVGRAI
jgi:insertion element IS1 protein InsB